MTRILLLLLLLTYAGLGARGSSGGGGDASPAYQQLLQRALALSEQRKWRAARSILSELVDQATTPDPTVHVALGVAYHNDDQLDRARTHYEVALAARPDDAHAVANLGFVFYDTRDHQRALELFRRAIALDAAWEPRLAHHVALALHYNSDDVAAEAWFDRVSLTDRSAQYYYDRGVTLERLGKIIETAAAYNSALELDPDFVRAWHNIAALHQQYGNVEDAIPNYMRVLHIASTTPEQRLMSMTNLATAYEMAEDIRSALLWYDRARTLVALVDFDDPLESVDKTIGLAAHTARAKRTACVWHHFEAEQDDLLHRIEHDQLRRGRRSVLMPFDTLLVAMDPRVRLEIARRHSHRIASFADSTFTDQEEDPTLTPTTASSLMTRPEGALRHPLRVGYISYDFTDHPTAHLLEGLFATHTVDAVAFGYGKDDGSDFRARLLRLVGAFVNLAAAPTDQCVRAIRARRLDVLMDAQGHTRGARPHLAAARPAPVLVNYLVYPGTSGASFVDYIVSDRLVTPPESLAAHFSEKLVLLPHSYQVNYYPPAVVPNGRASLWAEANDDDAKDKDGEFTFINFNKIDKLDPSAFALWMAILRRVPGSRLLLLNPIERAGESRRPRATSASTGDEIVANLRLEAAAHGIASVRIGFVPRVPKRDHLRRHRRGGLFLDTLVYGAHSTATDALYAGMPVLTLAGDSFASRVGVSLLANALLPELVTASLKEFEDLAVDIATQRNPLLRCLRATLRSADATNAPLFRTGDHVATLERAQHVMAALHRRQLSRPTNTTASLRTAHIIVVI